MKRLNQETGKPFKLGDVRADGYVFHSYRPSRGVKSDGMYREEWLSPYAFDKYHTDKKERSDRKREAAKQRAALKPPLKHKNSERDTLMGRLKSLLNNARSHAKQRNHDLPEITIEDLHDLWINQQGLCAYTKWQMDLTTGSKYVVSLERVDSNQSYHVNNVVLICWCVNDAKGKLSHNDFVALCKAVANHTP